MSETKWYSKFATASLVNQLLQIYRRLLIISVRLGLNLLFDSIKGGEFVE
jgi:hypothetical protein